MIPASLDCGEVKRACDFVALVSRYTRLRRAGRQYRGLCPFHSEHDPSFYVEPQKKIWKCFGCERGGDLLDFVVLVEGCDFLSALRIVSDFVFGVARESEPRSGERFRVRVGVSEANPSAREAGVTRSPKDSEHARLVARLDATERRLAAIRATNDVPLACAAERVACEPRSGELFIYTSSNNFHSQSEGGSHGRG